MWCGQYWYQVACVMRNNIDGRDSSQSDKCMQIMNNLPCSCLPVHVVLLVAMALFVVSFLVTDHAPWLSTWVATLFSNTSLKEVKSLWQPTSIVISFTEEAVWVGLFEAIFVTHCLYCSLDLLSLSATTCASSHRTMAIRNIVSSRRLFTNIYWLTLQLQGEIRICNEICKVNVMLSAAHRPLFNWPQKSLYFQLTHLVHVY